MDEINALGLASGEEVGGYRLISRLGGGAMGTVWRVEDGAGQQYAMKILRDSLYDEHQGGDVSGTEIKEAASARERLRREALALRRIHHPGVCQIVDLELDDALAFIVTELIDGSTLLKDVADNGRYIADDLERLARKLIDAITAVHAAGIIHRDIKPSNVMISATGPVLVDFGIAMGQGESHVTRTGLVMGTPGFIAPEIIDGAESTAATDWWSLTSVLAFAATGRPVFGSKPLMTVLEREAGGNADLSGLPERTRRAFQCALAPNPTARCTPGELLRTIHKDALEPDLWEDPVVKPLNDAGLVNNPNPPKKTSPLDDSGNSLHSDHHNSQDPAQDPGTAAVMPPFESFDTTPESTMPYGTGTQTVSLRSRWEDDPQPPGPEPAGASATPEPEHLLAQFEHIYAKRGTGIPLLLTIPIALMAATMPCVAILLAALAMWLMLTVGFNADASLDRLSRNAGRRSRGATVLRVVTLPWHMLRSLAVLIPRMVILVLITVAIVGICAVALGLPVTPAHVELFGRAVGVVLPADGPVSESGLALAGTMAISWLLLCFGPRSRVGRIGSGALRGVDVTSIMGGNEGAYAGECGVIAADAFEGAPEFTNVHITPAGTIGDSRADPGNTVVAPHARRGTILLLVWLALTLAAAGLLLTHSGSGIDWWPIPLLA